MGMQDYLDGEHVKIFYHPMFDEKHLETGNLITWHVGGASRNFGYKDDLPIQTLCYKYPLNFCIYDYRGFPNVIVIKNGKLYDIEKYYYLKKSDIGDAVYNIYGEELNIKSLDQFKDIKYEFNNKSKLFKEKQSKLLPKGFFETLRNNKNLFEKKLSELADIKKNTYDIFQEKWIIKDEYQLEKQLGEFLEVYLELKRKKYDEINLFDNPMLRYLNCKKAIQQYICKNEGILNKYLEWVNNSKIISKTRIEILVEEIFEPPSKKDIEWLNKK